MRQIKHVIIHELMDFTLYIATCESDCKDDTDKSVYRSVLYHGDVITMGKIIGEPVWQTEGEV